MTPIPNDFIDQILEKNDIVEWIGSHLPLKSIESNFKGLCPFHHEKTPSFLVFPKNRTFHCFGCGRNGTVIDFVMAFENLSYLDAVLKLAKRAGIHCPVMDGEVQIQSDLKVILRRAAEWFHQNLIESPAPQLARVYLEGRGFGSEVMKRWQLGYAPADSGELISWAETDGFTKPQLVESGLAAWRDEHDPDQGIYARFRDRVMIPICDQVGDVVAFSGRVLSAEHKGAKFVISPVSEFFNKDEFLFGFDRSLHSIATEKRAILVEGQFDVISMFEEGITNVVALQGTAFTRARAGLLKRHLGDDGEVVLCFDSDWAGYCAAEKAFRVLSDEKLSVRVAMLPLNEDPDSLIRSQGAEALECCIAGSLEFIDFQKRFK